MEIWVRSDEDDGETVYLETCERSILYGDNKREAGIQPAYFSLPLTLHASSPKGGHPLEVCVVVLSRRSPRPGSLPICLEPSAPSWLLRWGRKIRTTDVTVGNAMHYYCVMPRPHARSLSDTPR